MMEMSIGILYEKTLVFLDKDFCMCTLGLISTAITRLHRDIKRHYSIPQDWIGMESLKQCCMMQDGTLLCSKYGEVAVLKSDLGALSWCLP